MICFMIASTAVAAVLAVWCYRDAVKNHDPRGKR
jgi:hypothetical protein